MARFKKAILASAYTPARVNCFYDSITLGTGSDDVGGTPVDATLATAGYPGRLRAMLAAKFGTTPGGYIACNDGRTTVTGATVQSSLGPVMQTVRTADTPVNGGATSLAVGNTVSIPVPACTTIEILYFSSAGNAASGGLSAASGTFSYAIDGGSATTVGADAVNQINYQVATVSGLAATTHTVLLTGVSNTSWPIGIRYHSGNGFVVSRFGWGGATLADMFGEGPATNFSAAGRQRAGGFLGPTGAPFTDTVGIVSGSAQLTVADSSIYKVGMPVGAGAQLTLPAFVQSIDDATHVTLTSAATATNASRLVYGGAGSTLTGDLWIIVTGHNDWRLQNSGTGQPSTLPAYIARLQKLINLVTAAGGCVLLVGEPYDNSTVPSPQTYRKPEYWEALDSLARGNTHVTAIQLGKAWGGSFAAGQAAGYLGPDVHPARLGYVSAADLMFQVITG
jgi:hypothetical protein